MTERKSMKDKEQTLRFCADMERFRNIALLVAIIALIIEWVTGFVKWKTGIIVGAAFAALVAHVIMANAWDELKK